MDDVNEKLNALLSDPGSMAQIMQLAQQLSGSMGGENTPPSPPSPPQAVPPPAPLPAIDPQVIAKYLPLLQEQLRLAQDNYDDTLALLEIGAASQVEVDQAHQTLLSAQAGLEAAQASLNSARAGIQSAQVGVDSAQYQLSLYNLTAPINGVVEAVKPTVVPPSTAAPAA